MSVQNIQSNIQTSEQYRIRKQTEQVQQPEQSQDVQQLDEYDKTNPVGEEVEGIYSVSHDDEGNLKIDYRQPTSKTPNAGEQLRPRQALMKLKAKMKMKNSRSSKNNATKSSDSSTARLMRKLRLRYALSCRLSRLK